MDEQSKDEIKKFDLNNLKDFATGQDILKEIEQRIAHLENEEATTQNEIKDVVNVAEPEIEYVPEVAGPTTYERMRPFMLPLSMTICALFFSFLFVFFFLNKSEQPSVRAITSSGAPEKVNTPTPKPAQIVEEKEPEPEPEPVATPTPAVITFQNGTNTIINVKFAFNKEIYDTYPNGIYLTGEQIFEGDYAGFKILASNRAFANDFLFGVDRNKVNFLGTCTYRIDNAKVAINNMTDSTDGESYELIGRKYFRGKIVKVIESSKPYVDCKAGQAQGENTY